MEWKAAKGRVAKRNFTPITPITDQRSQFCFTRTVWRHTKADFIFLSYRTLFDNSIILTEGKLVCFFYFLNRYHQVIVDGNNFRFEL